MKVSTFLVILFICSLTAAQSSDKAGLLKSITHAKKERKISNIMSEQKNNIIQNNINENEKRIHSLRKLGKPENEIIKIMNASFKPNGMAGIEGTIYDVDGTTLKSPMSLGLFDEYGYYVEASFVDTSGVYGFYGIEPGKYYLRTEAWEYYINEFYNNSPDWQHAELVTVSENTITTNIDFYLDHHRGSISGRVKNKDGDGVTNCLIDIILLKDDYSNWYTLGEVDSAGYYLFTGVPVGSVYVHVDYSGNENYLSQWYEGAADTSNASIIEITENDTTKDIDFILDTGGAISGSLVGFPEGMGQYDCYISLYTENGGYRAGTYPDSNMNFSFTGLEAGKYIIGSRYNGNENYSGGYYLNARNVKDATKIDLPEKGIVEGITLPLYPAGAISGTITDENNNPVSEYLLLLLVDENDEYLWLSTNVQEGKYTLGKVPDGKYKINIPTDYYLDNWYYRKNSKEEADWITVNAPDTLKNIDLFIDLGSSISGSVFNHDGSPYTSVGDLTLYGLDGNFVDAFYLQGSDYSIVGVNPGKYKILLTPSVSDSGFASQWYNNALDFSIAQEIEVTKDSDVEDINFTLGYGGKVRGFLKNSDGQKLTGGDYLVVFYNNETGYHVGRNDVSLPGGFKFNLPYGSYKAAGISFNGEDSLSASYFGGGGKFSSPLSSVITINSGDPVQVDLVMEKAGGSIQGSIMQMPDSVKIVVDYIEINVYDDEGRLVKLFQKDYDSDYKINGLRPGNYYLCLNTYINDSISINGWYGLTEGYVEVFFNMDIPDGAIPITVGTGTTEGINIYYRITSVDRNENIVNKYYNLLQNYPNPFNPVTKISFDLKEECFAKLTIYNSLGQTVKVLDEGLRTAGRHNINFDAGELTSGIYFYRLTAKSTSGASEFNSVKKMILLK